jgi:hypothetical protein
LLSYVVPDILRPRIPDRGGVPANGQARAGEGKLERRYVMSESNTVRRAPQFSLEGVSNISLETLASEGSSILIFFEGPGSEF